MTEEWNRGQFWSHGTFRVYDFMALSLPSPIAPSESTEPACEIYLDSPMVRLTSLPTP